MLSLPYNIVLGSQSPRRKELLKLAGFDFRILDIDYEEAIPKAGYNISDIPAYLAEQKALHAKGLNGNDLLITADTLVFLDGKIMGKPKDADQAFEMLSSLSGKMHEVITGVCLKYEQQIEIFSDTTKVYFKPLEAEEIEYYIENYNPFDKAGAYGAQDWIGLIAIEKIEGSYFNVMGLPVHKVYESLKALENK
jgi:septum formation protein